MYKRGGKEKGKRKRPPHRLVARSLSIGWKESQEKKKRGKGVSKTGGRKGQRDLIVFPLFPDPHRLQQDPRRNTIHHQAHYAPKRRRENTPPPLYKNYLHSTFGKPGVNLHFFCGWNLLSFLFVGWYRCGWLTNAHLYISVCFCCIYNIFFSPFLEGFFLYVFALWPAWKEGQTEGGGKKTRRMEGKWERTVAWIPT